MKNTKDFSSPWFSGSSIEGLLSKPSEALGYFQLTSAGFGLRLQGAVFHKTAAQSLSFPPHHNEKQS